MHEIRVKDFLIEISDPYFFVYNSIQIFLVNELRHTKLTNEQLQNHLKKSYTNATR
ncbi:Hypothetical protein ADU72_0757 [Pediococcus damnosus]|uniref:Uncharacterized protein n=1 Tax=Pediococcus damnosus TaxID=51663 RepID=A0ABM6A352_9LACO|nr:Hypothetical protein ADU72_0757 [Pediococcus damnosus]GEA93546.1 hypothetical protein PDA01_14390 [Pediococcus damnosus]